jgi:ABC-2 type transport system permease protein
MLDPDMPLARELADSRDLMVNLTLRELRSKYKRSVLGWTWSLINPLAQMLIFAVVFQVILRVQPPTGHPSGLKVFALFLLCGLLPWGFLSNGIMGGQASLLGNANLVKKVYFRREVLVAASVASWLVSFLIEMLLLSIALLLFGNMTLPWIPFVALIMVLQTVFVLGIALILSVCNVYFRDTQHIVGIGLQLWFYATPIIYPMTYVAAAAAHHQNLPILGIYRLNPMVRFVEVYRDLLYDLRYPSFSSVAYLVVVSFATLAIGWSVFRRLEPRLAEEL